MHSTLAAAAGPVTLEAYEATPGGRLVSPGDHAADAHYHDTLPPRGGGADVGHGTLGMSELESHRVFAGVCPQTVAAYRSLFAIQHVRRSSVIFDQDDDASHVFLVLRGRIALNRIAPCGREIAPALLGPGSIVGADALSEFGGRRSARAMAITDATGWFVAASDLMRVIARDGTVASNVVRILCTQQEAMAATLEELATLNVVDRIARFLGRLAAPSDESSADTLRVGLPLTHEQIAVFVSSSRETVSLEMGRLARAGRVIRDRDGYAVRREA